MPSAIQTATLSDLYGCFPDRSDQPIAESVTPFEMPEPYRQLLVHTHHMTVTVERYYNKPVDVRVMEVWHHGDEYARKILLTLRPSGEVVQFGIVRINLAVLTSTVRRQIVDQKTPLGRVLIQNDVLRTVQPTGYFRVTPSNAMCEWFGLSKPEITWGRIGLITADGKPAVRVAEVLAPIRPNDGGEA